MSKDAKRGICYGTAKCLALLLGLGLILHWTHVIPAVPAGAIAVTLAAILVLIFMGRELGRDEQPDWVTDLIAQVETHRMRREQVVRDGIEELTDAVGQIQVKLDLLTHAIERQGGEIGGLRYAVIGIRDQAEGVRGALAALNRQGRERDAIHQMRLGELERTLDARASTLERMIREEHADVARVREEHARDRAERHAEFADLTGRIKALDDKLMHALGRMWEWARAQINELSKEHVTLDAAVRQCLAIAGPLRRPTQPRRARKRRKTAPADAGQVDEWYLKDVQEAYELGQKNPRRGDPPAIAN